MDIVGFIKNRYVDVGSKIDLGFLEPACYLYINPQNYFFFRKNVDLLSNCLYRTDGIFLTSILRLAMPRSARIARQSFDMTSLAPKFFSFCLAKQLTVYVAGGGEGDAEKFCQLVAKLYPGIRLVGFCNGYLDEEEIVSNVLEANADMVLLGLGNIRQERLAIEAFSRRPACYFSCGAFISQTARTTDGCYYPAWVNRHNLRWLFRFFKERHVFLRVLRYYPVFMVFFAKDFF